MLTVVHYVQIYARLIAASLFELLTPYKCYLNYMHEYHSSQHWNSFMVFSVNYVSKDPSGKIYIAFWDLGQILKFWDSWSLCW